MLYLFCDNQKEIIGVLGCDYDASGVMQRLETSTLNVIKFAEKELKDLNMQL